MGEGRPLRKRIGLFLFVKLPLSLVVLSLLWVVTLKYVPVLFTPLTIIRSVQNSGNKDYHTTLKWRSYEKISPEMARAVITSEDNMFDLHRGFDYIAMQQAIQASKGGKRLRGASTISQQTAKNVFCIPSRSFLRKGVEAYFTFLIERIWGKERIMEVYLNVAEMGPGIFGAEAAAQSYFSKHASELSRREACLIAVCLPNPLQRNPSKPTDYISRRANSISSMEKNLVFPSWVDRKDLTEDELKKEMESRQARLEKFQQRQKEARRKIVSGK